MAQASDFAISLGDRVLRVGGAGTAETQRADLPDAALVSVLDLVCLDGSPRDVLRTVVSIARSSSPSRSTLCLRMMRVLLSEDRRVHGKSRLAVLLLFWGLMDVQQQRDTSLSRVMLCLAGVADGGGAPMLGFPLGAAISRTVGKAKLLETLTPATVSMFLVFCRACGLAGHLNPRLSDLRTPDKAGYPDLSWELALRFGLFLFENAGDEGLVADDFRHAVVAGAMASGCRGGAIASSRLIGRALARVPRLRLVQLQVEFEDDAEAFRQRHRDAPFVARIFREPPDTGIAMPSDGSEVVGYVRALTGQVIAVERDRLTAPLRGSRGARRWNNEPVRRASLEGAVVSPNGLVLFGDDAVLDLEFANVPNRSGAALDRYVLGHYPEIGAVNDRSILLKKADTEDVDRAVLLCGIPNMENFGHFILNGVSKLPILREQVARGYRVIVPARRASFHDQILEYCGFDPQDFTFTGGDRWLRVKMLDVLSEAPMGMWPYNLLDMLRNELPHTVSASGPRNIYLARPAHARRSLVNEDDVIALLAARGFEVVRPELLPFPEQVAVMQAAETIVAPHGSALVTLMFAFGSKRIVEIETKTSYRMALYNFLGHRAVRLGSRRIAQTTDRITLETAKYHVDLSALRQVVQWATGDESASG